jgi:methionine synthase II (cobalamin-independent)
MEKSSITKDIMIEDLVRDYPFSVKYLSEKGIKCIACGEPIWGTLEEAATEKGFDDQAINGFLTEMKQLSEKDQL